jgi:hypothetical protein
VLRLRVTVEARRSGHVDLLRRVFQERSVHAGRLPYFDWFFRGEIANTVESEELLKESWASVTKSNTSKLKFKN